ncbi:YcxB family protein [bacterium]|nr:YcxB family protein [bacterium]MBP9808214.1 YcxB family protein [bacterium]
MTDRSMNPSEKANEPIFIWVQYKEEEINNGYWQVYKELQLPHRLFSMFALSFSVAMGYVLLSPESPVSSANTFSELMQAQYLPGILIAGVGIPGTCMAMVFLLLRHLSEGCFRKRPNFHFPMMYVLYPTGIQVQFATGTGMIDWRQFSLVLETRESFCLASNVNDVFVLPKRCFASAQEVDAVREILTASSRNFKKIGRDFNGADITYEKKAISSVMIDGEQYPIPDMEPPGSTIETAILPTPLVIEGRPSPSNIRSNSNDNNSIDSSSASAEIEKLSYPVSQSFESSLKTGLEVEVLYLSGEIGQAENIYFFRKRLVLLGIIYITLALLMPINFLALGYVWNLPQATEVVLDLYQHFVLLLVPIYIGHSVSIYWNIMQRTKVNDAAAQVFVFQLTEEGCGVRAGERYVVLAWWHFEECWETDEQLMLLLGSRGRTMFVIPKRVFLDRLGLAYATNLLQRKIKRYKVLA